MDPRTLQVLANPDGYAIYHLSLHTLSTNLFSLADTVAFDAFEKPPLQYWYSWHYPCT